LGSLRGVSQGAGVLHEFVVVGQMEDGSLRNVRQAPT
jgi:hypothetical protein